MSWEGTAWLGTGVLVYRGRVGGTDPHRHAAHQVLLLTCGSVSVVADGTVFPDVEALVIPSGVRHQLRSTGPGATGVTAWVDPDTSWGWQIRQEVSTDEPESWRACAQSLAAEWPLDEADDTNARSLAQYLGASTGFASALLHPYVERALATLTSRLTERTSLSDVAAAVGVSVPHLSRLWRRDLGLSFNAWMRWARLREAARLLAAGANITDAANAAGFADAAHASRVCHEMFGLPPVVLSRGITVI